VTHGRWLMPEQISRVPMTSFLLDTTVHIHWTRSVPAVRRWLRDAILSDDELLTSVVSVSEVYAGARAAELEPLYWYFHELEVVPVTHSFGVVAGRLRYHLAREGRQLHLADSLIAATAIETRCTLVTANRKDFAAIRGLTILDGEPYG
jgi:predicted nucleic acid-binding protein